MSAPSYYCSGSSAPLPLLLLLPYLYSLLPPDTVPAHVLPDAERHEAVCRPEVGRPHLAMILSNPLPGSEINRWDTCPARNGIICNTTCPRRSMITLGDSLLAKGQLFAAQFCYIVLAAEWGTFGRRSSKLVLLCSQVELLVKLLLALCSALCHVPTPLDTAEWFTLHPHPQSTVSNPPTPRSGSCPCSGSPRPRRCSGRRCGSSCRPV